MSVVKTKSFKNKNPSLSGIDSHIGVRTGSLAIDQTQDQDEIDDTAQLFSPLVTGKIDITSDPNDRLFLHMVDPTNRTLFHVDLLIDFPNNPGGTATLGLWSGSFSNFSFLTIPVFQGRNSFSIDAIDFGVVNDLRPIGLSLERINDDVRYGTFCAGGGSKIWRFQGVSFQWNDTHDGGLSGSNLNRAKNDNIIRA